MAAPIGMQSMNVGIQEGYDLGQHLADIIENKADAEKLEDYGRERRKEWETIMGIETALRGNAGTNTFADEHSDQLLSCLPASRRTLPLFAEHLGMDILGLS